VGNAWQCERRIKELSTRLRSAPMVRCSPVVVRMVLKVWNLQSTELVRTLQRDRPYERLNITRTQGLTPAQKATLFALGAFEEDGDAPPRQAELR